MYIKIYYDGDCPLCAKYVSLMRLKENISSVSLLNLRTDKLARNTLLEQGYDPDNGMLVDYNGKYTYGADAMNTLALLTAPSNFINKVSAIILSNSAITSFLYPIFRIIRWLALFCLGKATFKEEKQGDDSIRIIFSVLFALFSFFHFFNYAFEYGRFPPQVDQICILISALFLLFKPKSSRLLFLLVLVSSISTIIQAPADSNHTMVRTMWLMGYWLSFLWCMIKGKSSNSIFATSIIAGQGTLLVMYFFGIFHKINTDFLNPAYSCAVALWDKMPVPFSYLDNLTMDYVAIYGTFFVEGLLIVTLLMKRYRHIGIALGILFHLLLGLSSYAMYISFTVLAISLHCLFINADTAKSILNSFELKIIKEKIKQPLYILLIFVIVISVVVSAYFHNYTLVTLLAMLFITPFCYLVFKYGKPNNKDKQGQSTKAIGLMVTLLFFINCSLPYLGLKSAQAVNMFANIRLEGGVSNHLIFSSPKHYFGYLNDIVIITSIHGSINPGLSNYDDYAEVYYEVLAALDNDPDLRISYIKDGLLFENQSKVDLIDDIESILHPAWFRKWFHFQPVLLTTPEKCST